jgi:hypothetical protein
MLLFLLHSTVYVVYSLSSITQVSCHQTVRDDTASSPPNSKLLMLCNVACACASISTPAATASRSHSHRFQQ